MSYRSAVRERQNAQNKANAVSCPQIHSRIKNTCVNSDAAQDSCLV